MERKLRDKNYFYYHLKHKNMVQMDKERINMVKYFVKS